MAHCPECSARITIPDGAVQWDRLYCAGCGVELEILNLHPLELEAVFDFDADDDALEELEMDDDSEWEQDEDDENEW